MSRSAPTPAVLLFIALLGTMPSPTSAAWPTTLNADVPVAVAPGDQTNPVTISDGAGGVVVVWGIGTSGSSLIYAQRVDATGAPLWTTNGVALNTSLLGGSYTVVPDGSGGAIVGWVTGSFGSLDIRAQRVDGTGTPLWGPDGVPICAASNNQLNPAAVSDGTGGAILSWTDNRSSATPFTQLFDIYAQRVDAAGNALWTANGAPVCTAGGSQSSSTLAPDGAGGAVIGWLDERTSGQDIYAQRLDAAGTPQWASNGVPVAATATGELPYGSVSDGAGGAIVLYQTDPFLASDIYAQRVSSSGTVAWIPGGVTLCAAAGKQIAPTLVADGLGGAIAAWLDNRSGTSTEVYAQRVDGSGSVQWTTDGVAVRSGLPSSATFFVRVISDGGGGAVLSWPDSRNGATTDLYAQRLSTLGSPMWALNGVAVCTAANDQVSQGLVPDGVGGGLLAWQDSRNGNKDIYAQRVSQFGSLGGLATDTFGNVAGAVTAQCPTPGSPLLGVIVDAFAVGSGSLLGTAVTDANGNYSIPVIPVGDYTITLVVPLGYTTPSNEVAASVIDGQTTVTNFGLACAAASGKPAASGFWKHQFGVATGGNGSSVIDAATLCAYLDLIEAHFNNNALNQVVVYDPPSGATCAQKLDLGKTLLNTGGSAAPIDKARQQLLSLLLNVAANYVALFDVISKDGATASQAITFCDGLIDGPTPDYALAAAIADKINSGQQVSSGVIPLTTEQIAYRQSLALLTFRVTPNPGPGSRRFEFSMGAPGRARLSVFDVSGRMVCRLMDGAAEAGLHSVSWNGATSTGSPAGGGLYFARLETTAGSRTLKVIQVAR